MLHTFKIRALIKGQQDVFVGNITVSDIENVKEGFKKYGHLLLDHEIVETDVVQAGKLLPLYLALQ